MDITPEQLSAIKRELADAAAEYAALKYPKHYRGLDYKYGEGTRYFEDVYVSFSDEELLNMIRERKERTGRAPRDFQLLDVYATYISDRFLHWNEALLKALPEATEAKGIREIGAVSRITLGDTKLAHLYQIAKSRVFDYPTLADGCKGALKAMEAGYSLDRAHIEFYLKLLKRVCRNRRLFEDTDTSRAYSKQIGQLLSISEALGRPPIIVEVPDELGMALWYAAGDWSGVHRLCGLPYMDWVQKNKAEMEYGALHATPEMLPPNKRNKLSEREYGELTALCDAARELGYTPGREDMTNGQVESLVAVCPDINTALRLIGLIPRISEKKAAKEPLRDLQRDEAADGQL